MFCPECKAEYQTGFSKCSDCRVELVERLEKPIGAEDVPQPGSADYVVVATVTGAYEDSQICSFLEANGIPAQIRSDTVRKTHSIGIWPVEILVPRESVLVARHLLEKANRGDLEIAEE